MGCVGCVRLCLGSGSGEGTGGSGDGVVGCRGTEGDYDCGMSVSSRGCGMSGSPANAESGMVSYTSS